MTEETLLGSGAVALAEAVHSGRVTPLELVEAHIRRIEEVNGALNALVADRFAAAREEAAAAAITLREAASADALRAAKPLLGVPFTVKEMIAVEGMPLTFGCRNRLNARAARDATVVARLRAAGAIPLGVSNVPEWGMWNETYNSVYGRTNNPWDVRRTPGGSSGGEGALVGAGCSAFGIGSDIGGSIRMPAAFCGVYGHKPGRGLLPLTGHYPVYATDGAPVERGSPALAVGPLARSAADLMPLLRVMRGADGIDPDARDGELSDPAAVAWRGRRVLLLPAPRIRRSRRATPALAAAVRRAGAVLQRAGAQVSEAPDDLLAAAADYWFAVLQSAGGRGFAEVLGGGRRVRLLREVVAAAAGRGTYSWPALFFCIGERIGRRSERGLARALEAGARLERAYRDLLGDDGILITPVHPRAAPRHNEPVLFGFDFLHTAVFNALQVPVTVAPMGFDARGLPLSVQVSARGGGDHLTIAAALALEASQPAWRPADVEPARGRRSSSAA